MARRAVFGFDTVSSCLSILVALCASAGAAHASGSSAADVEQLLAAEFAADAMGFLPRVAVDDSSGVCARGVFGRLRYDLSAATLLDEEAQTAALRRFVDRYAVVLCGELADSHVVRLSRLADVDGFRTVAFFNQFQGHLRVLDSEMSVVLDEDGALLSFDGYLRSSAAPADAGHARTPEEVLGLFWEQSGAGWSGAPVRDVGRSGEEIFVDEDGRQLERAVEVDSDRGRVVWEYRGDFHVRLDEQAASIVSWDDLLSHVDGTADVTYEGFFRDGSSLATSLHDTSDANGSPSESLTSDYFSVGGVTCIWMLEDDDSGLHRIDRVDDADSSEVQYSGQCSTGHPVFNATSGSAEKQQIAFVGVKSMRTFIEQNVLNHVPADQWGTITPTVDSEFCASACFDPNTLRIHSRSAPAYRQDTWWHEYGHYVVWSYYGLSGNCNSIDQGDAINETVSNVFAMITAVDDPDVAPRYGALGGTIGCGGTLGPLGGQAPPAHGVTTPGACTDAALMIPTNLGSACSTTDHHHIGWAFEQAVWELLWNLDCSSTSCGNSTAFNNDIWSSGETQEEVIEVVGRSLGFALKVTGKNTTFGSSRASLLNMLKS